MKENRKLLKEVLKDIRHDMTDEEVLNLLADSKISVKPTARFRSVPKAEKKSIHWDRGRRMPLQSSPEAGRSFSRLPADWCCGWL